MVAVTATIFYIFMCAISHLLGQEVFFSVCGIFEIESTV